MILVSVLLVAAAFGLLIAGSSFFLSEILLVYASIGVSLLAALLLGVGAFRRRSELVGSAASESPAEAPPGSAPAAPSAGAAKSSPSSAAVASGGGAATAATAATKNPPKTRKAAPAASVSADVPGDAQVLAVPARRTYHTENCRQLRTREHHELGYAEAREQGYTACTSCMPDSVLAARAGSASAGTE